MPKQTETVSNPPLRPSEAELFKAELDILFKKYPTVQLNVAHQVQVVEVEPIVPVPSAIAEGNGKLAEPENEKVNPD